MIDLLQGGSQDQAAFVLAKPLRGRAGALVHGMPTALRDPRLSRAGSWLAATFWRRQLEALTRVENWQPHASNERELGPSDREISKPLLARVGDQAGVVAEVGVGTGLQAREDAMTEEVRHEIIQRRQSGMSMQQVIADGLGHSRRCGGPCAAAVGSAPRMAGPRHRPDHDHARASSIRSSRF